MTAEPVASTEPVLSVVLATLDEATRIGDFLDSVLAQDLEVPFEILVVDGGSSDDTREIVSKRATLDPRVHLLDNPDRKAPFAFNIGVRAARGTYVAILGAHCRYPANYLRATLSVVADAAEPTGCGGLTRTVPAGPSLGARLAAAVAGNSFASSSRSFRTQTAGEVDSIPYPVYRREDVLAIGGFDERLVRNQDNDLSDRLRQHGVRLVVTDECSCDYVARADVSALLRHAFLTGQWNARTIRMGVNAMKPRHFIPAGFVAGLVGLAVLAVAGPGPVARLARWTLLAALAAHLGLGGRSALQSDEELHGLERAALPPTILAFHLAYGSGTFAGLIR